jgi:hypothetical protein
MKKGEKIGVSYQAHGLIYQFRAWMLFRASAMLTSLGIRN